MMLADCTLPQRRRKECREITSRCDQSSSSKSGSATCCCYENQESEGQPDPGLEDESGAETTKLLVDVVPGAMRYQAPGQSATPTTIYHVTFIRVYA